ncbi:MAG TPA: invasion associated locus B family protein [Stellaceae bacterium]|nr:invasion associated locus B family protein [Stellaceae bacterium]
MIARGVRLLAALTTVAPLLWCATPAHAAAHKKGEAAAAKKAAAPKAGVPAAHALGVFDKWTAYEAEDKSGRVCYLAGEPQKSAPSGFARKQPMAMVTHRPAENIANVVSFVEGYPLKDGSEVTLAVGKHKFDLFTNADSAWASTADLDKTIVTALAKAGDAVVKGTPQKGPPTTDVYSLAGFPKALAAIDKACGVKREAEPRPPATHHRPQRHHSRPARKHS